MNLISRFFHRRTAAQAEPPAGPAGARVYAIGDVHGQVRQLERLRAHISADIAENPVARVFVVFVGDLIDRGPDSAGVVEMVQENFITDATCICLMGNHEEMLLRILDGEADLMGDWLAYGGLACIESYGIDVAHFRTLTPSDAVLELAHHIPRSHRVFFDDLVDSFRFGDYLFVHAGVRPGIPLGHQSPSDLRWIRAGFLDWTGSHGAVVVHGHTIVPEPQDLGNRIAIDTGAYAGGPLTALIIENRERYFLQAE